jgi:hypothetical protein
MTRTSVAKGFYRSVAVAIRIVSIVVAPVHSFRQRCRRIQSDADCVVAFVVRGGGQVSSSARDFNLNGINSQCGYIGRP